MFGFGFLSGHLLHGWNTRLTEPRPREHPLNASSFGTWNTWLDERIRAQRDSAALWRQLTVPNDSVRDELHRDLSRHVHDDGPGRVLFSTPVSEDAQLRIKHLKIAAAGSVPPIEALLFEPATATEPRGAVLALHGSGSGAAELLANIDYHHGFARALAQCGLTVLAPIQVAATTPLRTSMHLKAAVAGESLLMLEMAAFQRALDVLIALPGVDSTRIGAYGISLGGRQALLLGAVDPRIDLVVVSGHFTDRSAWLLGPDRRPRKVLGSNWASLIEPDMGPLLDDRNAVALIAPRGLIVEVGKGDPRYREAVKQFEFVEALYSAHNAGDNAELSTFEGGHEISQATVRRVGERLNPGGVCGS